MPNGKVFLSYLLEDERRVAPLKRDLESRGVEIIDGRHAPFAIDRAIAMSELFVACFSDHGHDAEALRTAISQLQALEHDRSWLIAVRLTACEVPAMQITSRLALTDFVVGVDEIAPRLKTSSEIDTTVEVGETYGSNHTVIGRDIEGDDDIDGAESTRVVVKKMISDQNAIIVGKRSRVARPGSKRD